MKQYEKCKYPKCQGNIIPNKSQYFCAKHHELAEFVTWLMDAVKLSEEAATKENVVTTPEVVKDDGTKVQ